MAKIKRLYFDIETSYCTGWFWRPSFKTSISYDQVLQQAKIICICYKWSGSEKIHSLKWDKGCDKILAKKFATILMEADEVIGHNSDKFDLKWVRTRVLFHGAKSLPEFKSIDTLKISRAKFNFPSNRLDAIGKYLGFGGKKDTGGIQLWHDIIQRNSAKAMNEMVEYCKRDVGLLEKVFLKLEKFAPPKTHAAVFNGGHKADCPNCGSNQTSITQTRYSAKGTKVHSMKCKSCNGYFSSTPSDIKSKEKADTNTAKRLKEIAEIQRRRK